MGSTATPTGPSAGASIDELEAALNDVAGHLNAQHARLVDLTAQLLDNEAHWAGPGIHTPEQFLAWRVGVSPERARQLVTIAHRVSDLPICIDTFRRGQLSVDQMAAIAKRAPWWTDQEICDPRGLRHLHVGLPTPPHPGPLPLRRHPQPQHPPRRRRPRRRHPRR